MPRLANETDRGRHRWRSDAQLAREAAPVSVLWRHVRRARGGAHTTPRGGPDCAATSRLASRSGCPAVRLSMCTAATATGNQQPRGTDVPRTDEAICKCVARVIRVYLL